MPFLTVAEDQRAIGRGTIHPDGFLTQLYELGIFESGEAPLHDEHELAPRYEQPLIDGQGPYHNLGRGMVSSPSGGPGVALKPIGPAVEYYPSEEEEMACSWGLAYQLDRYESVEMVNDAQP
jgi:hypothetical protein